MLVKVFTIVNFWTFYELMEALVYSFNELGFRASYALDDQFPITSYGDVNVVITGQKSWDPTQNLPSDSYNILIQTEELWNRRDKGIYDKSNGWDLVLELYAENVAIPRGTENVVHFPMGWSNSFGFPMEGVDEDNNVFFFGSMTPRRKEIGSTLAATIPGVAFQEFLWGPERDTWIYRSKINLGLKAIEQWSYAPLRCLLIQCKGKFCLVEKASAGYGPYVAGLHFIEYGRDELASGVAEWIQKSQERHAFAMAAYEDLRKNHPMTTYLERALKGRLL